MFSQMTQFKRKKKSSYELFLFCAAAKLAEGGNSLGKDSAKFISYQRAVVPVRNHDDTAENVLEDVGLAGHGVPFLPL